MRALRSAAARMMGVAIAAGLLVAGCGPTEVTDKTGSNVIVLRLATLDVLDSNGQSVAPTVFIKAVERLSGGRIRVSVREKFEDGQASAETDIVKAITTGDLDGGWPSSRAFSRAGIRGLEPIEAPLTLTSYAAEKALVTGPAAKTLLGTLRDTGVVGLGLAVGPLRRPWALKLPLVEAQRWHGIRFRSYNSPVQEEAIRALGAEPVLSSYNFPDLVLAGTLDAVETDAAQYEHNGLGELLPNVAGNVVLWPRVLVLSLSQRSFDALSETERGWVQRAAAEAVQASVDFPYDDAAVARRLCGLGVRFATATPDQLATLHRTVQPVLDALARDPATRLSMAEVARVAADRLDVDALDVPVNCRVL
jgi:TRAP-type C4-dicarboxylate transport system substrate-binding protein